MRIRLCRLRRTAAAAIPTRNVFADGKFEIRISLESQLLAELHHARLTDAQRVRELLRRVVAQQVRVFQQEVRNAALDCAHLVTLRADFEQRAHGHQAAARACRPWISLIPSPGACVIVISDSLKITPPTTGLNW